MQITSGTVSVLGPSYADLRKARDAAKTAAAERKHDVQQGAAKALSSWRFSAADSAKEQARAKLVQIRDRMNILKKLFGANPKEMAKALAQVFKELKAAVQAYKDADDQEMGMAGDVVDADLSGAGIDAASSKDDEADAAKSGPTEADTSSDTRTDTASDPAAKSGASLYDDTVRAVRDTIGADGLEFVKEVRSLTQKIQEVLEAARGQARIRKADRDTDEAFKQADEALGSLDKAMSDMTDDIQRAAPAAGMQLSVAA